jgi:hypothetical protein
MKTSGSSQRLLTSQTIEPEQRRVTRTDALRNLSYWRLAVSNHVELFGRAVWPFARLAAVRCGTSSADASGDVNARTLQQGKGPALWTMEEKRELSA